MIDFQEDDTDGYRSRTIKNASADVTIAIAVDFDTAGEKLTKSAVLSQNNLYLPVLIKDDFRIGSIPKDLAEEIIKLNKSNINLNIAGNGMYRLKDSLSEQKAVDYIVHYILKAMLTHLTGVEITLLRTGGQSGVDEAGAKAGVKLGIPTLVLAPKGWKYRDIDNNDILNETLFKERFTNQ
jgi:hypothetical protein